MKTLTLALAALLIVSASACSKPEEPATAAQSASGKTTGTGTGTGTATALSSYDQLAASAKGFTVGALMSAQPVYVLFDPQCPHCGRLWQASVPLHSKVKFIWVPIAFNPEKSLAQGAALLSAADPAQAMTAHEASLLAGNGGMAASADVAPELAQAVKSNTQLLTSLGADSVPYLVAVHRKTGQVISHSGAMETAALSEFLGVE